MITRQCTYHRRFKKPVMHVVYNKRTQEEFLCPGLLEGQILMDNEELDDSKWDPMDPLPPGVRAALEEIMIRSGSSGAVQLARRVLKEYPWPRPKPAPRWVPGDVVVRGGRTYMCIGKLVSETNRWISDTGVLITDDEYLGMADGVLLVHDGEFVKPPEYKDYSGSLRSIAYQHPPMSSIYKRLIEISDALWDWS